MEVHVLLFTSMEVNLLPFTSMEVALEVDMEVASFSSLIYFYDSFHQLASTSMGACFYQVAPASMEATNYYHVLPSTSMEVGGRPTSMEVAPT